MMKFKLKILTIFFFLAFTIPITADEESYDFSSLSNFLQKEITKGRTDFAPPLVLHQSATVS